MTVFGGDAASPERIYGLRGQVTDFARAIHPLIGPLDSLRQGTYAQVPAELLPFFGDVADHLRPVDDEARIRWSSLGEILQANIAVISLRQAEVAIVRTTR